MDSSHRDKRESKWETMTLAWVLIVAFHIGYGDQGVTAIQFANKDACVAGGKAIVTMRNLDRDEFRCVDQMTGESISIPRIDR